MKPSLVSIILGAALAGCASVPVPAFPEPDRTWSSYSGQLQYVTAERSVIGEFMVSRRGNDFRLDFSKGGAVPLIRVSRHDQFARAEGAFARGQWQGVADKAPLPLEGWVVEVPRAFAGLGPIVAAAGSTTTVPGKSTSGTARRLEIKGAQPRERFVFVFNQ
jgi:hypothetical protein